LGLDIFFADQLHYGQPGALYGDYKIGQKTYVRIMDKSAAFAVGWELSGRGILETLDNGRFTGAVIADDQSQWGVEGYGLLLSWPKGAHSHYGELLDPRHGDGATGSTEWRTREMVYAFVATSSVVMCGIKCSKIDKRRTAHAL